MTDCSGEAVKGDVARKVCIRLDWGSFSKFASVEVRNQSNAKVSTSELAKREFNRKKIPVVVLGFRILLQIHYILVVLL